MTQDDIAKRLGMAGISLDATEHVDLAAAYAMLAPMLETIRTPAIPPEAEPAIIFLADT